MHQRRASPDTVPFDVMILAGAEHSRQKKTLPQTISYLMALPFFHQLRPLSFSQTARPFGYYTLECGDL